MIDTYDCDLETSAGRISGGGVLCSKAVFIKVERVGRHIDEI